MQKLGKSCLIICINLMSEFMGTKTSKHIMSLARVALVIGHHVIGQSCTCHWPSCHWPELHLSLVIMSLARVALVIGHHVIGQNLVKVVSIFM